MLADDFETLLEFENNSKVLEYRFKYRNLLIWPYVRYAFFLRAMTLKKEQMGLVLQKTSIDEQVAVSKKVFRKIRDLFLALSTKRQIPRKDILFMTSNGANVKNSDGKMYNRLYDELALVFSSQTAMLEKCIEGYSSENRVFPEIISARYMDYIIWLSSMLKRNNKEDTKSIDTFLQYMRKEFPDNLDDDFYFNIRKQLMRRARSLKTEDRLFRSLLVKMSPKLIFAENACYGYDKAYKVWIINDMKIPVYEIQHGRVCLSEIAYNYSELLLGNKEYHQFLPTEYLVMGDFWKDNLRIPIACRTLGNANFTENIRKMQDIQEVRGRILIILSGVISDSIIDITEALLEHLSESYSIVVKGHPVYCSGIKRFEKFDKFPNFSLSTKGNISEYIAEAEYVIGDSSTVLYEAAGCGKTVFVYRNSMSELVISKNMGNWFDTPEELLYLLKNNADFVKSDHSEEYFNSHWRENYINLVHSVMSK